MSSRFHSGPPCQCRIPSKMLQVRKDGPNHGRFFYLCQTGKCKFFLWKESAASAQQLQQQQRAASSFASNSLPNDDVVIMQNDAVRGTKRDLSFLSSSSTYANNNNGTITHRSSSSSASTMSSPPKRSNTMGKRKKQGGVIDIIIPVSMGSEYDELWSSADAYLEYLDCHILNDSTLRITFPYKAFVVTMIKQLPTAEWDGAKKEWHISISEYEKLLQLYKNRKDDLAINFRFPPYSVHRLLLYMSTPARSSTTNNSLQNSFTATQDSSSKAPTFPIISLSASSNYEKSPYYKWMVKELPTEVLSKLKSYQLHGIIRAFELRGRVFFADEMGLGKTLQALCVAYCYRNEGSLLIICPSSLRFTWASEIHSWFPDLPPPQVITTSKDVPTEPICIASYSIAQREQKSFLDKNFNTIILDESHFIKSFDSKRTKAIVPMVQKAKRAILLSGTPALSRPIELYSQLLALDDTLFPDRRVFGERYCDMRMGYFGMDMNGSSNLPELSFLLEHTIMIRRLKDDVLTELPPKRRQCVIINSSSGKEDLKKKMEYYKRLCTEISQTQGDRKTQLELTRRNELSMLYAETGVHKIKGVLEYVSELIESSSPPKFLIFAHHRQMLDSIDEFLTKRKISHIRIDGETNSNQRQDLCDFYQKDPNCLAAVLGITVAGVGLTLHSANLVIFAELYWNPGQLLQGEDRVHRVGQRRMVDIKYLLCNGTVDDIQWPLIIKKLDVVGQSLGDEKSASSEWKDAKAVKSTYASSNRTITAFLGCPKKEPVASIVSEDRRAPSSASSSLSVQSTLSKSASVKPLIITSTSNIASETRTPSAPTSASNPSFDILSDTELALTEEEIRFIFGESTPSNNSAGNQANNSGVVEVEAENYDDIFEEEIENLDDDTNLNEDVDQRNGVDEQEGREIIAELDLDSIDPEEFELSQEEKDGNF